jgi:predicted nucleic acid-binding protein
MKIAVNDANILFDLIDLGLIHYLFQLEYTFYTTDIVVDEFKNEYQKSIIQDFISNSKLSILSIDDINKIYSEKQKYPRLSIQDCSVLITAKEQNALILTGDNHLRKTANTYQIEVHGILWIFDELIDKGFISFKLAYIKLTELLSFNKRLPINECNLRLKKWENKI